MFISELKKVKGLGSAKNGTSHWWYQRLSAILLLSLVIWLAIAVFLSVGNEKDFLHEFLAAPYNIVPLILLIIIAFYHAKLGVTVVIEDYVSNISLRYFLLISVKIFIIFTVTGTLSALVLFLFNYYNLSSI